MTPEERDMVTDLFSRLASLEGGQRDPDAERLIAEGLRRAPNAIYALVQTTLIQDEALRAADDHIRELEAALGPAEPEPQRQGGFLDSMRDAFFGREEPRQQQSYQQQQTYQRSGSVPSVGTGRDAPMGVPPGFGQQSQYASQPGHDPRWTAGGQPMGGGQPGQYDPQQQQQPSRGGSFLGTAAAGAVGAIGGALLLDSFRGMLGGGGGEAKAQAFGQDAGGGERSPWGGGDNNSSGDMARDAGLGDIGGGAGRQGMYDTAQNDANPSEDDYDYDGDADLDDGGYDDA